MKQKKYDDVIIVKCRGDIKKRAEKILDYRGLSISDFVREKIAEVIEQAQMQSGGVMKFDDETKHKNNKNNKSHNKNQNKSSDMLATCTDDDVEIEGTVVQEFSFDS